MAPGRIALGALSSASAGPGGVQEVEIHGLSSQGSGVGRLSDGRTVFVPRTAPGERVRIRLERVKPRWAEGRLLEIVEPAPERRRAQCTRFDVCGGCQLQHLPEDVQRTWKARFVADALERIGGLQGIEPPEVVGSPKSVGYRNRMSFSLRRLRGGRVVAGLHALGRPAHVVEIDDECVLPESEVDLAWQALRRGWGPGARLLPGGGSLRLTLRTTDGRGVSLTVEGGEAGWDPEPLLEAVPDLGAIAHRPERGPGAEVSVRKAGEPESHWGGFEQVNSGAAELLRAHVVEVAGAGDPVVDAYCGSGPYGRALAERGRVVVGIELDAEAAAAAGRDAPEGFEVRAGPVEELLPGALPAETLIVNPPRTGLESTVVDVILDHPPARLVYVSCDPATLARDLERLAGPYRLDGLRCFDLFPQTAHVETVVVLNLPTTTS